GGTPAQPRPWPGPRIGDAVVGLAAAAAAMVVAALAGRVGTAGAATAGLLSAAATALGLRRAAPAAATGAGAMVGAVLVAVEVTVGHLPLTLALVDGAAVAGATAAASVATRREARRDAAAAASSTAVLTLSRSLAGTVEELHALNADLEAANADLRQFGYVVSHDLGEPLRTMSGFARLLRTEVGAAPGSTADEWLTNIDEAAVRMQRMIDDLRAYTMAGQADLASEDVALADTVADATDNLAAAIAERGALITSSGLPTVRGDRSMLTLVMQNLLANAIKFTPTPPRIDVTGAPAAGGRWRVTVSDDGIGIDPARTDRAFALFGRLQAREAYPGTGLGLAICKRVVERHGGAIDIGPRPGARGTVVTIELPAS
ncbi:MAG TPA: ATP-binding protein, partial [Acidimicrobiales bacterium]|nr:ATP-binding protein [Acidimicrobiales bacterium]